MDIKLTGVDFHKGLSLLSGIVPSIAIKSVLQGIKFEFRGKKLELSATDLEVFVRYYIEAREVSGESKGMVLHASRLGNIARDWAGSEEILISVSEGNCVLKSKGGYFKLKSDDVEQFPSVSVRADSISGYIAVDGDILSSMISKVLYAVSTIKARSVLCGVLLWVEGDDLVLVSADGNRMSIVRRKILNPEKITINGIVTAKCLSFIQKFSSEEKGVLKFGLSESQLHVIGSKGEIISQLIDGQYPKYEEVVPKENDKKAEVNKEALLAAIRMASYMTSEGYRVVKFRLTKNKLNLSSRAADVGEAEQDLDINYEGPDFEISFNPDYVIDALKASDIGNVVMELGRKDGAAIFRTGHEQINIIMPIESE
jgi:DNA polymerase III beta subunit